jgi:hypothetical protein
MDRLKAEKKFDSLFSIRKNAVNYNSPTSLYNTACSASLDGLTDTAFFYLNAAIQKGFSQALPLVDNDLKHLHADPRWRPIEQKVKESFWSKNASLTKIDLAFQLNKMYYLDQNSRFELMRAERYVPHNKEYINRLQKEAHVIDSLNQLAIVDILDKNGWPIKRDVGERAAAAAFLIIQHADLKVQKKYYQVIEDAASTGEIRPSTFAYLSDRIRLREGKKQLYGTQYTLESGQVKIRPIEDEDRVDDRRRKVGLGTMQQYIDGIKARQGKK